MATIASTCLRTFSVTSASSSSSHSTSARATVRGDAKAVQMGGSVDGALLELGDELVVDRVLEGESEVHAEVPRRAGGLDAQEGLRRVAPGSSYSAASSFRVSHLTRRVRRTRNAGSVDSKFCLSRVATVACALLLSVAVVVPATKPLWRVLVAEDDAQMRALVVDALRREGFVVDEVADGRRMWAITIHYVSYDLIVSDSAPPDRRWTHRARGFRKRSPTTRVILMTAFGDDATRERADRLGAVFLDKPFQMRELRAAALRLCDPAGR